jgi:hypothetical protein
VTDLGASVEKCKFIKDKIFANKVLSGMFWSKCDEVGLTEEFMILYNEKLGDLYRSPRAIG